MSGRMRFRSDTVWCHSCRFDKCLYISCVRSCSLQKSENFISSFLSAIASCGKMARSFFFFLYEDNRNVTQPGCKLLTSDLDGQVCVSTAQCALQIRHWNEANCGGSVSYYSTRGEQTGLDRTEGGHMGSLQMESFHFASCNKLCQTSTDDEKWCCSHPCLWTIATSVPVSSCAHNNCKSQRKKTNRKQCCLLQSFCAPSRQVTDNFLIFFFCCLIAVVLTAEAWVTHRYGVVPKKWFMTTSSLAITFEMLGPSSSLLCKPLYFILEKL